MSEIVSVEMPDELVNELDENHAARGYMSRSGFIRAACAALLADEGHPDDPAKTPTTDAETGGEQAHA